MARCGLPARTTRRCPLQPRPGAEGAQGKRGRGHRRHSTRQALLLRPDHADARHNLGYVLWEQNQFDGAIAEYREALRIRPDFTDAWINLGNALKSASRTDEAGAAFLRAIDLSPGHWGAYSNLGTILSEQGKSAEAVAAFSKAIELNPTASCRRPRPTTAASLLGAREGLPRRSSVIVRHKVALRPGWPDPHLNLALALLLLGDFQRGLPEYEWRVQRLCSPRRDIARQWDGADLTGKTLLLHTPEQGAGDTIQFIRYAPLIAAASGRVLLECPRELCRLFRNIAGIQFILKGEPLPPVDLHCALPSLPLALGTRLETIPAKIPYLHPDPALAEAWGRRIGQCAGRLKVGLAWAGNPKAGDRQEIAPSPYLT